jgi:hypothetical protein
MNAMKLSEFILSDEPGMRAAVLHEGVLVAKRNVKDGLVFLFQMDDYYVETYCNLRSKAVLEYRAFQNINTLTPYLEAIPIDDLLP